MKSLVFNTSNNIGLSGLRIVLSLVIFSHGAQSMLGWFGGSGLTSTLAYMTSQAGLNWFIAFSVICIQFFGSIMLFIGLATRIASLGIFGIFIGMASYHFDYGFFMNWFGTNPGEGFEYHVLVIGMCIPLIYSGAGSFSVDRKLVTL